MTVEELSNIHIQKEAIIMKKLIDYLMNRAHKGYAKSLKSLNGTCITSYIAQADEDVHMVRHLVKDVLKDKGATDDIDLELSLMDDNTNLGLINANMKDFYQSLDTIKSSAEIAVMDAQDKAMDMDDTMPDEWDYAKTVAKQDAKED